MSKKKNTQVSIPEEVIISKILFLREEKVILDLHLAQFYEVETRTLKQAVRRNIDRFPDDFMFELNEEEIETVVSQNVIPFKKYLGGASPFAFTETGVAMLSSVLKSMKAIAMNVVIMRTFVALRKMAINYQEIMQKLNAMEAQYDEQFKEVYTALTQSRSTAPPADRLPAEGERVKPTPQGSRKPHRRSPPLFLNQRTRPTHPDAQQV